MAAHRHWQNGVAGKHTQGKQWNLLTSKDLILNLPYPGVSWKRTTRLEQPAALPLASTSLGKVSSTPVIGTCVFAWCEKTHTYMCAYTQLHTCAHTSRNGYLQQEKHHLSHWRETKSLTCRSSHKHSCSLMAHTQPGTWCQQEPEHWQGRHSRVLGSLHSLTSMAPWALRAGL